MKIDKNSWHCWLYNKSYRMFGLYAPTTSNLCQYVRRTFLFLGLPATVLFFNLNALFYSHWLLFKVEGAVLAEVAVACAITYVIIRLCEKSNKPKGLFSQWLSAKKQKVCPLIDFE